MSITSAPLYFRSGNETLFGWLHQPPLAMRSDIGVVICKPFGYESVCSHRSLRAIADACAAVGTTVLRFDYTGTGDSSGSDGSDDQIIQWCADIKAAVALLRDTTGMRRVCLLGVRLGALLASVAASESAMVDAVIAVAPVVSGRRYLRELRTFQAATVLEESPSAVPAPSSDGSLEISGFRLSAASADHLSRIDIGELKARVVPNVLILDRSDLPGAKGWADTLLGLGADIRYRALPGFVEMVSTPHAAEVPEAMVAATVEWLERYRLTGTTAAPSGPVVHEPTMYLAGEGGSPLVERARYVDAERTLFAIITQAQAAQANPKPSTRYGVVMLNGGATNHIGPNRMYVELARRWAARGYVVLRLDLAGLGDSDTRQGRAGNEVYPPGAVDDIAMAIEFLRREHGVEDITLTGLCAGAYHALRSARAGLPVNTVLMVNPLTFYWKQGSTLNDLQISEVVRNPGVYAEHVLTWKYWRKLLRGRVNLWRIAMVYLRRTALGLDSTVRDAARRLHIRLPNDLGWDLQSIASRGVRIVFLFARGDTGADLLKVQGGSALKLIGERCRIYTIDGADHIFSQGAARAQLLQLLSSELPK